MSIRDALDVVVFLLVVNQLFLIRHIFQNY